MKRLLRVVVFIVFFFALYIGAQKFREARGLAHDASPPRYVYLVIPLILFPLFFAASLRRLIKEQAQFEVRPLAGETVSADFHARVADVEAMGCRRIGDVLVVPGRVTILLLPLIAPDQLSYATVFEIPGHQRPRLDFDSLLADGRIVTSSSSELSARAPVRSDVLIQVFPNAVPADLYSRHREALAVLASPCRSLSSNLEDYVSSARECRGRLAADLGAVEALVLQVRRTSPHSTPIASRPRT